MELEKIREEVQRLLAEVHGLEPGDFDPPDDFWAGLDLLEAAMARAPHQPSPDRSGGPQA